MKIELRDLKSVDIIGDEDGICKNEMRIVFKDGKKITISFNTVRGVPEEISKPISEKRKTKFC